MSANGKLETRDWGLLILRIVVGTVFLVHGGQKLFSMGIPAVTGMFGHIGIPLPAVSAVVVMLVEFGGGLAVLLGLFTRWAALLIAIDMAGAILFVHGKNGFLLPMGFEYAFTHLGVNLALALMGAGRASLDALWRQRL